MTLRELREESGMSQAEFSKRYGIPLRTYQSWETGERKPAPYIVHMITRLVQLEKEEPR